ncbi:CheC, inhibitor of MCP methylation [Halothermothrix orenii H 168]|uniref:CheC, inhibitor of MCP methylation n=2 Tax=Halothermothrix orenii TaxID=31909 RepID=B8CYQ5_HALOH|nr:CheC, inhibitor of MCP methylation [Halothermothrix orenii H 168]
MMDNQDKDILSQEEIDALMDNSDEDSNELTHEERDVLGEIGNIAMGSAATALSTILDQKVEITTPKVEVVTFKELSQEYERPCVLVRVKYISGLEGINLLIIKEEDAMVIADLMMGGDGTSDEKLDEIHLSAIGEAMNQMMGSSSTSMSSILNEVVNISPPETKYLDIDELNGKREKYLGSDDEKVVSISFRLKVGDLIDSSFKQIAPMGFTKQLAVKLVEEMGGLTAKDAEEEKGEARKTVAATASTGSASTTGQPVSGSANRVSAGEENVDVKRAQFPSFDNGNTAPLPQNMELIQDVPLEVTVRLGKTRMTIKQILDLGEGSIVELEKLAGEPVDLLVNGKLIAKGEVVVIDENFGFRVKDIISPMERLNNI